jgi:uncharacterized protein
VSEEQPVSRRRDLSFSSHGETCAAWHLIGEGDAFAGEHGRPCVVMAHGIGGTRDSSLLGFAEAFAEAGLDVLLFDYRCFGDSARGLGDVDPNRIVLWGTSWSGGHVVYVAAYDPRIAAVIAQSPDLDGRRTLREITRYAGWRQLAKVFREGLKDIVGTVRGRAPHLIPVVAPPGEVAAMASQDAYDGYQSIAGPTWRNEVAARAVIAESRNRAITRIDQLLCPILIQIADRDTVAPPPQARAAAWRAKGRVEVREYPCLHFNIYLGEWHERAIADQLHFLRRHLGRTEARTEEPAALSSKQ